MSKSFASVGVAILDIVGYPISSIPAHESTLKIMQASSMSDGGKV